jgi:hypothetical protein
MEPESSGFYDSVSLVSATICLTLWLAAYVIIIRYVAVMTLLGSTALIPLEMRVSPGSVLLGYLYVAFIVIGACYVVLLYRTFRAEGRNVWQAY